jgi:serine/threonine protein kinase
MAITLDQFVWVVQESGLVGQVPLSASLREVGGEFGDPEPSAVAANLVSRGLLTTWQADKLLAGVDKGFFLGKHKLLRLLANGSMSAVYEAEHLLMQRRVALKVLPKSLVGQTSFLERFYREARAVARLNHPNIVRGFDVGQEGDYHYFVMEFVEGSTLQDRVAASGPLPIVEAAEAIRQAALGLQHAHEAGLVHRDIKPANLLIDREGTVKVLDLGLVRSLPHEIDGEAGLTRLHDEAVLGTVDYLSPEQAIDSHNVDIRSDLYSLGCTFYFLLTGGPPFPSGTLAERLLGHQNRSPTPLEVVRRETPTEIRQIVLKMMAKRPEDRYQTPGEVSSELGEWLTHRPDLATVPAANPAPEAPVSSPPRAEMTAPAPVVDAGGTRAGVEPTGRPRKSPTRPLTECWDRWSTVVEAVAASGMPRRSVNEAVYQRIYEELLLVCRIPEKDADEATLALLWDIEDLVAPWPTLRSLASILRSEMRATVLHRFHEIGRIVRARSKPGFFRRLIVRVFAP